MSSKPLCPDCECPIGAHNAVNRVGLRLIAHCGGCGACWKSEGAPFVALLLAALAGTPSEDTE
jgi:hypothetical protein